MIHDHNLRLLYFRSSFLLILDTLGPHLVKQTTNFRSPIKPDKRLAITLRYLASGSEFAVLAEAFGVGLSTVREIICETCEAITEVFDVPGLPKTPNEFREVAAKFMSLSNFPGVIGCIDGTHIPIAAPKSHKEDYYCYKGYLSIMMLAVAQEDRSFCFFNIGHPGKRSDGGVFSDCGLEEIVESFPQITGNNLYHCLADSAFTLTPNVLKPYPQSVAAADPDIAYYNYRLSATRMIVECGFGILKCRFRALMKPIQFRIVRAQVNVVAAAVYLHNFLIKSNDNVTDTLIEDEEYQDLSTQYPQPPGDGYFCSVGNKTAECATEKREFYVGYLKNNKI